MMGAGTKGISRSRACSTDLTIDNPTLRLTGLSTVHDKTNIARFDGGAFLWTAIL